MPPTIAGSLNLEGVLGESPISQLNSAPFTLLNNREQQAASSNKTRRMWEKKEV